MSTRAPGTGLPFALLPWHPLPLALTRVTHAPANVKGVDMVWGTMLGIMNLSLLFWPLGRTGGARVPAVVTSVFQTRAHTPS